MIDMTHSASLVATALDDSQQSRQALGTVRLYHIPNSSIGKLGRLAVDLSARGLGLGRRLVEALEEDAKFSISSQ